MTMEPGLTGIFGYRKFGCLLESRIITLSIDELVCQLPGEPTLEVRGDVYILDAALLKQTAARSSLRRASDLLTGDHHV